MAVPFRKTSKSARDKRRSHLAIKPATMVSCSNCGFKIKSHRVCSECGFYKGKEAIKV